MIFFVVVVKDASVETGMLDYPSISLVWQWMGTLCCPPDNYKDHCQKGALCITGFRSGGTHGAPLQCDEGSLRRRLPRSHVVWPGFVSLSELFSGMSLEKTSCVTFPQVTTVLSVLSIQLEQTGGQLISHTFRLDPRPGSVIEVKQNTLK